MSRGHGKIERAILGALASEPGRGLSSLNLAALVYDSKPDAEGVIGVSAAQSASVRRAVANLRRAGKVYALGRQYEDGSRQGTPRTRWATKEAARAYAKRVLQTFGPKHMDPDLLELAIEGDLTSPADRRDTAKPGSAESDRGEPTAA